MKGEKKKKLPLALLIFIALALGILAAALMTDETVTDDLDDAVEGIPASQVYHVRCYLNA